MILLPPAAIYQSIFLVHQHYTPLSSHLNVIISNQSSFIYHIYYFSLLIQWVNGTVLWKTRKKSPCCHVEVKPIRDISSHMDLQPSIERYMDWTRQYMLSHTITLVLGAKDSLGAIMTVSFSKFPHSYAIVFLSSLQSNLDLLVRHLM